MRLCSNIVCVCMLLIVFKHPSTYRGCSQRTVYCTGGNFAQLPRLYRIPERSTVSQRQCLGALLSKTFSQNLPSTFFKKNRKIRKRFHNSWHFNRGEHIWHALHSNTWENKFERKETMAKMRENNIWTLWKFTQNIVR